MTTLAGINETLESHTPLLEGAKDGINKLEKSFSKFFMGSLDDLEAKREAMGQAKAKADSTRVSQAQGQAQEGNFPMGMLSGLFAGLGSAFSLGTVLALFKALLKRGVFAAAALVLADEIGEYVKGLTGSDLAGELTEKGLIGASIGGMLFGKKGIIAGAILGAVTVFADKIAKNIDEYEIAGDVSYAVGQGASAIFTIGSAASVGFLLAGPLGAVIGTVGASALEVGRLIGLYKTDEKFKKQVDEIADKIKTVIDTAIGAVANTIDTLFDGAIRTQEERKALQTFNPKLYEKLLENEKQLAMAVSKFNREAAKRLPDKDKLEKARLEMMKLKGQRSEIEEQIKSEEDAAQTIYKEGEFGTGASIKPASEVVELQEVKTGRDFKETLKKIAMAYGKTERAAGMIAGSISANAQMRTDLSTQGQALFAEKQLARELGLGSDAAALEKLRSDMESIRAGGSITQNVDASTKSGDTYVSDQTTNISAAGSSVDKSDLVSNAMQRISGRPLD